MTTRPTCQACGSSRLDEEAQRRRCRRCLAVIRLDVFPNAGSDPGVEVKSRELREWAEGEKKKTDGDISQNPIPQAPVSASISTPHSQSVNHSAIETATAVSNNNNNATPSPIPLHEHTWRRHIITLRFALAIAVLGALIGIIWTIGNWGLGVADCFWNAGSGYWSDCQEPDWKWRSWPLFGFLLCLALGGVILYRLYILRHGAVPIDDNDAACSGIGSLLTLVAPFAILYCGIHSCFCNQGHYCEGRFPRTDYYCDCDDDSDDIPPPCLWQYMCFTWSEILFGLAAWLCALGWYRRPQNDCCDRCACCDP